MNDTARGGRRYRVVSYPRQRLPVLDVLATAARQYTIHGLIEVDVTATRELLARPGRQVSFTAFVVATVARAVRQHPQVNARRTGRRLVLFDDVDAVVTIERPIMTPPPTRPTGRTDMRTDRQRLATAAVHDDRNPP